MFFVQYQRTRVSENGALGKGSKIFGRLKTRKIVRPKENSWRNLLVIGSFNATFDHNWNAVNYSILLLRFKKKGLCQA